MPKMGTRMPNMGTVRKHGNIRVKAAALRKAGLIDALGSANLTVALKNVFVPLIRR